MTRRKKKLFESVEEIFKTYIPDYVPAHLRESRKDGRSLSAEFTSSLLNQFKEVINKTCSSLK